MFVALIVSFLAVFLSLFDVRKKTSKFGGFELGFLLLTVYLCIRYDYGNDYMSYLNEFERYNSYNFKLTDFSNWADLQSRGDYGWVILNKLAAPLGFFGFVMALTILYMGQLYYIIKKYVPPKWYWFSIFLFAFHPQMMVVGVAGMMRQWLVIFIFICCINLIRKRRLIPFMVIMLAATTIHKTAFIVMPFYFITYLNFEKKNGFFPFLAILVLWFMFAPFVAYDLFMPLFESEQLSVYSEMMRQNSGYNIIGISSIITIGMPLLCLSQIRAQDESVKLLVKLVLMTVMFFPLVSINGLIGRIGVYFLVFALIVYPLTIDVLQKKGYGQYCFLIIAIFIVYYIHIFTDHFTNEVWYETSYLYKTIFTVPWQ